MHNLTNHACNSFSLSKERPSNLIDTLQLTTHDDAALHQQHGQQNDEELLRRRLTVIQVIEYVLSHVLNEDEGEDEDISHELAMVADTLHGASSVYRDAYDDDFSCQGTSAFNPPLAPRRNNTDPDTMASPPHRPSMEDTESKK